MTQPAPSINDASQSAVSGTPWLGTFRIRTGEPAIKLEFPKQTKFGMFKNGDKGQLSIIEVGTGTGLSIEATDEQFTYDISFDFVISDDLITTISSLTAGGTPINQIVTIPMPPGGFPTKQQFIDAVNIKLAAQGIDLTFATTDPAALLDPQALEDLTAGPGGVPGGAPIEADLGATARLQISLTENGFDTGKFFEARARRTLPPVGIRSKELWIRAIKPPNVAADYEFEISIVTSLTGTPNVK